MTGADPLYPKLRRYVTHTLAASDAAPLDPQRRAALEQIADFVRARQAADQAAALMFICTHNSRRSHIAQLWAAAAAAHFGVESIQTSSAGTEATAFNPRAIAALQRAGFVITAPEPAGDNPHYQARFGPTAPAIVAFSKTWEHPFNPSAGFAAIMTCAEADDACPHIPGAALRVALPYDDPKQADGTDTEAARYDARTQEIAAHMLTLFRRL